MTSWIAPLAEALVAGAQALAGARAEASEAERALIDDALEQVRATDTRATARHDADLAVRLTRGRAETGPAPAVPPPSPFEDAVATIPSVVELRHLPPDLRARVIEYERLRTATGTR